MKMIRDDFPILTVTENDKPLIYLDNAATTSKPLQVLRAVEAYYRHDNANPHRGVYELAARATKAHEDSRTKVAEFLNASPDEIIFTQNTTESLNLIAYSYGMEFLGEGDEIVLSVAEHHSNLVPWQRVAKRTGAKLVYLYPDSKGHLTEEELNQKITSRTRLVAVGHVSNVLGIEIPVSSIVRLAHQNGAVVVLDCAQSAPHMQVDVKRLDVDFAAFSGHKLYGPMGIGVLYGRKELLEKMPPFLTGGDMIGSVHEQNSTYAEVPRRFEAGTRNVGGEVGLAAAIDYLQSIGWENIKAHERELMTRALEGLAKIPHVTVYGDLSPDKRHGVISFNVEDVHPHDTATLLDADGITVRAGHHCAQPLMEYLKINACVRVSFAVYNTAEEVEAFLNSLRQVRRWMGFGSESTL
ncbi:aminotransferase class V-fold PLP-dependent enzyme [Lacrimispora sp. JR3]|uniref:aminotransferase class V-fold PLP-dependent enzyme n=1 Tax=Lacrimispora sinapis TaxID=3111456 RepID=UPI00374A8A24